MLDTLRYSKRLQAAGVDREQAEAQAEALQEAVIDSVATRDQLEAVEIRLRAEIRQLRWVGGVILGLNAAILVKLLIM